MWRYSKYKAKKSVCLQGHIHDSKKEADRCNELYLMQKAEKIKELEIQKKFLIVPAQYKIIKTNEIYKKGAKKGEYKEKKICDEKAVYYKADFYYFDVEKGEYIIEDTKGMRTTDYIIKRKLMKQIYCNQLSKVSFIET